MATTRRTKSASGPRARKSPAAGAASGWQASADVVAQRLDDEVILVQLETDCVYALNPTAARIWELVAARKSPDAIERALSQEFAIDAPTARRSVANLLSALREKKLVRGPKRAR